jgi:hypothetical protein
VYLAYGLRIRSDVPLPIPAEAADGDPAANVLFARAAPGQPAPQPDGPPVAGLPCDGPCHNGAMVMLAHRGPGGTWFWHEGLATCHIAPDARRIDVYPAPDADERALGLILAGPVLTFVLHQLGYPCLHASAILAAPGGVAFLGPSGQGKSTLAAGFLRDGVALLSDDILALRATGDGIECLPGLPLMKVWPETAERALALEEELPCLTPTFEKRLLALDGRHARAGAPARLRALYILRRYDPTRADRDDVAITPLRGRAAHTALLAQTLNTALLHSAEAARLLPLYQRLLAQASVRLLAYPHGYQYQGQVRERILADLAALAGGDR